MKLLRSILILSVLSFQIQLEHAFSMPVKLKQVVGYISSTLDNKMTRYYRTLAMDCSTTIGRSISSFTPSWLKNRSENDLTFEELIYALTCKQSIPWNRLCKNKRMHNKIYKLIADNLVRLIDLCREKGIKEEVCKDFYSFKILNNIVDFFEEIDRKIKFVRRKMRDESWDESAGKIYYRLKIFFNEVNEGMSNENKFLIEQSLLNNLELFLSLLNSTDEGYAHYASFLLETLFEKFVFFRGRNGKYLELNNNHYCLIFLYNPCLISVFYTRNRCLWVKKILIKRLLEESSNKKYEALEWIKNNINELDYSSISWILEEIECDEAENILNCLRNKGILNEIISYVLSQKRCPCLEEKIPDIEINTIHEQHCIRNCDLLVNNNIMTEIFGSYVQNLQLKNLFYKINEKTKALQDDYYIFVHAQKIQFYALQQWYTALRSLVENRQIPQDYCYPWLGELKNNLDEERVLHEKLIKEGYQYDKVLFMNYAFFANMKTPGSSSAYFFYTNSNAFSKKTSLEWLTDVFTLLKLKTLYEKYKDRLEKHAVAFDQLSTFGNMLLIVVPKKKIAQSVYLSYGDASRKKIEIKGIGETDDIAVIMEALEKHPEKIADTDHLQFCLIMTQSPHGGGLNPDSGIKIIPFNCIEQEKLRQFEKEKNELLALIEEDIEVLKKVKSDACKSLTRGCKL